mgnify:CR=1 FL=1
MSSELITGYWPNMARAYEIALVSGLTISLHYDKEVYPKADKDIDLIKQYYGSVVFVDNGDIMVHLCKPDYNNPMPGEDIFAIYTRYLNYLIPPEPMPMSDGANELLNTATNRLDFSLPERNACILAAKSCAIMDNDKLIKPEHMAEAIHYKYIAF